MYQNEKRNIISEIEKYLLTSILICEICSI